MHKTDKLVYEMIKGAYHITDGHKIDKDMNDKMWDTIQKSQISIRRWVQEEPDDGA